MPEPLFRKVDAIQIIVPDLDAGLEFYRDKLGHSLNWRSPTAAGLRMAESDAEIVLQTDLQNQETDLLVDSATEAATRFAEAGGTILATHDIPVGRVAVVRDPWDNVLVLLDLSKGRYTTDGAGNVTGVASSNDD